MSEKTEIGGDVSDFHDIKSTEEEAVNADADHEGEEETTNAEVGMKCNDLVISENKEEYIGPAVKEAIGDDETLNSGGSQYNKDEYLTYNGMEI